MKQLYWDTYVRLWSWIRSKLGIDMVTSVSRILKANPHLDSWAFGFEPFDEQEWKSGLAWGRYHPKSPHQWWGGAPVSNDLYSEQDFKRFKDVLVPYRSDVVRSDFTLGYGLYVAEVSLYPSEWDWMAFWLYSDDGIGEIDVFEYYTDPIESSEKFETTVHYGDYTKSGHKRTRAIKSYVSRSRRKPAEFALLWLEDKIEIYFNGALARKIVDKNVLQELAGKKMQVIFNCGVQPEKAMMMSKTKSRMTIEKFEYYQELY